MGLLDDLADAARKPTDFTVGQHQGLHARSLERIGKLEHVCAVLGIDPDEDIGLLVAHRKAEIEAAQAGRWYRKVWGELAPKLDEMAAELLADTKRREAEWED